jgi:hypothetical protein
MTVGAKELDLLLGGAGGGAVAPGSADSGVAGRVRLRLLVLLVLGLQFGDEELRAALGALGRLASAIVGTMDLMPVGAEELNHHALILT